MGKFSGTVQRRTGSDRQETLTTHLRRDSFSSAYWVYDRRENHAMIGDYILTSHARHASRWSAYLVSAYRSVHARRLSVVRTVHQQG